MAYPSRRTFIDHVAGVTNGTIITNSELNSLQLRQEEFCNHQISQLMQNNGCLNNPILATPSTRRITLSYIENNIFRCYHSNVGLFSLPNDLSINYNALTAGTAYNRYDYLYLELYRIIATGQILGRLNIYQDNSNPSINTTPDVSTSSRNIVTEDSHCILPISKTLRYQTTGVAEVWESEKTQLINDLSSFVSTNNLKTLMSFENILPILSNKMLKGESVTIGCYGDSTTWGYLANSSQASVPAPAEMQARLRSYYNNNNITVNNHGIPGAGTTNFLTNEKMPTGFTTTVQPWSEQMAGSSEDVIIINMGLNDIAGNPPIINAITLDQYKNNIINMIITAKLNNKAVILQSPNICYKIISGSPYTKKTGQITAVLKELSKIWGCGFVDVNDFVSKAINEAEQLSSPFTLLPDGTHPSEAFYKKIGQFIATAFISDIKADQNLIVCSDTSLTFSGTTSFNTIAYGIAGISVGCTSKISIPLYVTEQEKDVYLLFETSVYGSNDFDISINGVIPTDLNGLSIYDNVTTTLRPDTAFQVLKNPPVGVYFIDIINNDNSKALDFQGVLVNKSTTNKYPRCTYDNGLGTTPAYNIYYNQYTPVVTPGTIITFDAVTGLTLCCNLLNSAYRCVSNTIDDVIIELNTTLSKGDGIIIFGGNQNSSGAISGLLVGLNLTSGYLEIQEQSTYPGTTTTTLGAVDLSGAVHTYKIKITKAGVISVFVDGVQIGSNHNLSNSFCRGGYLGIYSLKAAMSSINSIIINSFNIIDTF